MTAIVEPSEIRLPAGKKILFDPINASTIQVTTNVQLVVEHKKGHSGLSNLDIGGAVVIATEGPLSRLVFRGKNGIKVYYDIRQIKKTAIGKYLLISHPRTVCSYFLPPLVAKGRKEVEWDRFFINAYLVAGVGDSSLKVGLLFRFFPCPDYLLFEYNMRKRSTFMASHEMDFRTTLMIFSSVGHEEDVQLVSTGKYSSISDELKERIMKFHDFYEGGDMWQILNKAETRRKKLSKELGVEIPPAVDLLDKVQLDKELICINEV